MRQRQPLTTKPSTPPHSHLSSGAGVVAGTCSIGGEGLALAHPCLALARRLGWRFACEYARRLSQSPDSLAAGHPHKRQGESANG